MINQQSLVDIKEDRIKTSIYITVPRVRQNNRTNLNSFHDFLDHGKDFNVSHVILSFVMINV